MSGTMEPSVSMPPVVTAPPSTCKSPAVNATVPAENVAAAVITTMPALRISPRPPTTVPVAAMVPRGGRRPRRLRSADFWQDFFAVKINHPLLVCLTRMDVDNGCSALLELLYLCDVHISISSDRPTL